MMRAFRFRIYIQSNVMTRARNMRGYFLTETEKETIKEYLSTGKKLDGFRVLKMRAFRLPLQTLKSDIELVEARAIRGAAYACNFRPKVLGKLHRKST